MAAGNFEKRLARLEAIEQIKQLQVRYVNALVYPNWDDLIDCFADDAIVDMNAGWGQGKEEITRIFKVVAAPNHIGQEGPFAVHPIISVDGDTAKGSWLMYLQFAQPRKLVPRPNIGQGEDAPDWRQGFYETEYKKMNGQWKISFLKYRVRLLSPRIPPSSEGGKND